MTKRVGILLGDFFWSSIPYDGLQIYELLKKSQSTIVDLIMFKNDIRLTKQFKGNEKFHLDTNRFYNCDPCLINDWNELAKISEKYDTILSSAHLAPKTRFPFGLRDMMRCTLGAWDIGGADILTNAIHFADEFYVKGPVWKTWLQQLGVDSDSIYVTGSPHYDDYRVDAQDTIIDFCEKYDVKKESYKVLVTPSNPLNHREQYKQNMEALEELCTYDDVEIFIKTYPHDYMFYENETAYSGVYRRILGKRPQYQMIKDSFPGVHIVESQDHHAAMVACDSMFNMSGSHIAWESFMAPIRCYTMNLRGKPYHNGVKYLPDSIVYPDDIVNRHVNNVSEMLLDTEPFNYAGIERYIQFHESSKGPSAAENICAIVC